MSINVDFSQGAVNSFVASGGTPTYGSDGVSFTIAKSGDSPQLSSVFYIMFGRVQFTMKAAPGAGIVSSLVLESDDLDEVDLEWLGADNANVQTNYFGKGVTGAYDRGQFNPAAGNHDQFITYTVDWTSERIVWSVGTTTVRTLNYGDANGQFPQSPMRVKFGAWSGGDASNAPGVIQWADGPTNYAAGPFTMTVKSIAVTDYSTGKSYTYGDSSGTWQSIKSNGGTINGNLGSAGSAPVSAAAPAATNVSPSVPVGGIAHGSTSTQTGWPWTPTSSSSSDGAIPSGWMMTSSGKIVPASSTVVSTSFRRSGDSPQIAPMALS
jgi:beta-glucanase (GH16 family)